MSLTRKIAHNTFVQIIGKAVSTAIGLVVIGMLTRYLAEEGFGQYYTIMTYLQFFGVIVDFGLYVILVKKISEPGVDESRAVSNVFTMRCLSAVVFLGVAPLLALALPYPHVVKVGIAVTTVSIFAVTLVQTLSGIFQRHLRMHLVSIAEVAGRIVLAVATWWVIAQDKDLLWIMAAVVAGSIANVGLLYGFARRIVPIMFRFDFAYWRDIIREAWPIAVSIVFNLVYLKSGILILSLMKTSADVGVFGSSNKVLEVLVTFPAMFAGLILPLLASAWVSGDRVRFQFVVQRSFDFLVMIALPLLGGVLIVAQPVMQLVTGEGFVDAGKILQILIVATSIIFIGNLFGIAVLAVNRQRTMMWLYCVVATVSLAGNLLLIPRFSYFGAAWMNLISELLITSFAMWLVVRTTHIRISMTVAGKVFLATAVMAITLSVLDNVHVIWLACIGAGVYVAVLYLIKGIDKRMIQEVMRLRGTS